MNKGSNQLTYLDPMKVTIKNNCTFIAHKSSLNNQLLNFIIGIHWLNINRPHPHVDSQVSQMVQGSKRLYIYMSQVGPTVKTNIFLIIEKKKNLLILCLLYFGLF